MSEENINRALREFGLTEKEAEVYILLAREGVLKGLDISKRLRMHKAQVYTILKNLQSKGTIETTLESPTRFAAIPFDNLLDLFIRTRKEQAISMEREKASLVSSWESLKMEEPESPVQKFLAVRDSNNVNFTISSMIRQAKKEITIMMAALDIIRAERLDQLETLATSLRKTSNVRCRILTHITKENLNIIKNTMKVASTRHLCIEWRHTPDEPSRLPRLIIKDREEVFILQLDDAIVLPKWNSGLWTNSKPIISLTERLFNELWAAGIEAKERIDDVESSETSGKTLTISDTKSACKLFDDTAAQTSKEIIAIIPSIDSLAHFWSQPIQKLHEKGVSVRVMVPINAANIDYARKLSRYCNVRDPSIDYLGIVLMDKEHVFRFKEGATRSNGRDRLAYFKEMYYTNEPRQVEKMAENLEGLWLRSIDMSDIESKLRGNK